MTVVMIVLGSAGGGGVSQGWEAKKLENQEGWVVVATSCVTCAKDVDYA
jgi:hypothetical protein